MSRFSFLSCNSNQRLRNDSIRRMPNRYQISGRFTFRQRRSNKTNFGFLLRTFFQSCRIDKTNQRTIILLVLFFPQRNGRSLLWDSSVSCSCSFRHVHIMCNAQQPMVFCLPKELKDMRQPSHRRVFLAQGLRLASADHFTYDGSFGWDPAGMSLEIDAVFRSGGVMHSILKDI